jgi:hypothetical protein
LLRDGLRGAVEVPFAAEPRDRFLARRLAADEVDDAAALVRFPACQTPFVSSTETLPFEPNRSSFLLDSCALGSPSRWRATASIR